MHHRWKRVFAFAAVLLGFGSLPASAQVPDPNTSWFVPQAGSLAAPCEGVSGTGAPGNCTSVPANGNLPAYSATFSVPAAGALLCARTCPNLDGGQVLRNWARLKIVVRMSDGTPIANIPTADICVLFNGGSPAQGFAGVGADAIAADPQWSGGAAGECPALRCIQADAPTDAAGETYITWIGHLATDPPGMGNRDPGRKWGGYDSELPVFVLGVKLRGQLATTGPGALPGNYNAIVRNYDMKGSNLAIMNTAERVTFPTDYNYEFLSIGQVPGQPPDPAAPAHPYFDRDFDGNGTCTVGDYNLFIAHLSPAFHTCIFPINDP